MATAKTTEGVTYTKGPNWGNFEPVAIEIPRRLLFRSWGWDKSGKNHFGMTAPGPILGLYFDPGGIEGVAEKFIAEGKEIRAIQYRFHKKMARPEAQELWDQFLDDYEHALTIAKTVQIDETELWELARFKEFGRESDTPREYGPLNGEYRTLLQNAYDAGVNLQLIQKVKQKWVNNKETDEMKPLGFQQANFIVQINLEHSWTPFDPDTKEGGFSVRIVNCRQNMDLAGTDWPNLTFPALGELVYPDSQEEEWQ